MEVQERVRSEMEWVRQHVLAWPLLAFCYHDCGWIADMSHSAVHTACANLIAFHIGA